MIIYCITNTVNNKKYIGQTRNKLARRWSEHLYDARSGRGGVVHTAMRKYGDDKFTIEQIDSARTLRELGEKETAWIERLNTHIRSGHGYNVCLNNDTSNTYGTEFCKRLRQAYKHKRIPIIQFNPTTGKKIREWSGLSPAARALHISVSSIYQACKSPKNTKHGNGFCYKCDYEKEQPSDFIVNGWTGKRGGKTRAVYSLDSIGNKREYASVKLAAATNGISSMSICDCLRGRTKSCVGNRWFYLN